MQAVPAIVRVLVGAGVTLCACGIAQAVDAAGEQAIAQIRERLMVTVLGSGDPDPVATRQAEAMLRRVVSNGVARDASGTGYWDTLRKGPARTTALWRDLGRPAFQFWVVTQSLDRLVEMSHVYANPRSPLHGNAELAADIVDAVDFAIEQKYNDRYEHRDWSNWYDIEISIPFRMLTIALLLDDAVPAESRERWLRTVSRFTPDPTKVGGQLVDATGANRMWKARVALLLGVLERNVARIDASRRALDGLMGTSLRGDGFRYDGAFIQHRHFVYNGGYGLALMADFAMMLHLLDETPWAIDPAERERFLVHLERGFLPTVYRGTMFDMMRGREIARQQQSSLSAGLSLSRVLLRTALALPAAQATRYRAIAKGWLKRSGYEQAANADFRAFWDQQLIHNALHDDAIHPAEEATGFVAMNTGARAIHRTPRWAAALSMTSPTIAAFESINGENRRGWNTGNGHLSIVMSDAGVYARGFWPTVDAHRLAGSTVVQGHRLPGDKSTSAFVGAAGTSTAGVATMQLSPRDESMSGRVSWFFFGDQIVCLGTDLSTPLDRPLESVIENRPIVPDDRQRVQVDGRPIAADAVQTRSRVRTAHIEAGAPGESIGIYFLTPAQLHALQETRADTWKSVNATSLLKVSNVELRNRFATLWIDHGKRASGARYAYVLLPTATPEQLAAYAKKPSAKVVQNDTDVQAVVAGESIGAVFGGAARIETGVGVIEASAPCLVALTDTHDSVELSVAHPSARAGDRVIVSVRMLHRDLRDAPVDADDGVTVDRGDAMRITFSVPETVEQVRRVRFMTRTR